METAHERGSRHWLAVPGGGPDQEGMAYSPQYGCTDFTVPMFDGFMRRMMPDWSPDPAPGKAYSSKRKEGRGRG